MGITIRVATPEDAPALCSIYTPYVKETAITFEYDCPSVEVFAERIQAILEKYPYLVAEEGEAVVGYAYASPFHNNRTAYQWAVEASIYVDKHHHGKGIGRLLYDTLEKYLQKQGVLNVNVAIAHAEKDDPYLPKASELFHARMGYRQVGIFHACGYKFNRWYGIMWMEKHLGAHIASPCAVTPFQ